MKPYHEVLFYTDSIIEFIDALLKITQKTQNTSFGMATFQSFFSVPTPSANSQPGLRQDTAVPAIRHLPSRTAFQNSPFH